MYSGLYVTKREKVKRGWKSIHLDVGQIKGIEWGKGCK